MPSRSLLAGHVRASANPQRLASAVRVWRIVIAVLILLHGLHRAFAGSLGLGVGLFGQWLNSQGLPLGYAIALGVTIFELVGPALLLAGRFVSLVALGHAFILIVGMLMVHLPFGWFVVGAGRNGMEYSVLLITGLLSLAWVHWPRRQ